MKKLFKHLLELFLKRHGYKLAALGAEESVDPFNPRALRRRLFRQLDRLGFQPAHIVDVGAHAAEWSWDARAVFRTSAFTLIEPQVELKPHLEKFCAGGNACYFLAGAAAADGERILTIAPSLESSSFLVTEETAREQGLERRRLPVLTLDTICSTSAFPLPEVVKIDAEGLELEILTGAGRALERAELIFLEVPFIDWPGHPTLSEMLAFMADRGYAPYDLTDLNRHPEYEILNLVEIAFARREGALLT